MVKERMPSSSREGEDGFVKKLKKTVEQAGGRWAVEIPTVVAFYVPENGVAAVEEALGAEGYEYEGDEQGMFADVGKYMKFLVGDTTEHMFRVSLKGK